MYTWEDLIVYTNQSMPRPNEPGFAAVVLNATLGVFWDAADWRETLGKMKPFHPIPGEQDIPEPFLCKPADFRGLRRVTLENVASDPPQVKVLNVRRELTRADFHQIPEVISFDPANKFIRLFPAFPKGQDPTDWVIRATYKKEPPRIRPENLSDPIPFDDDYFFALSDVLAHQLAKTNPARRNEVRALEEQAAFAIAALSDQEGMNLGQTLVSPGAPLDAYRWTF